MTIADELRKLQDLHRSGALTDEEFAQAKAAVLGGASQVDADAGQVRPLFPIDPFESLTPQSLRVLQIVAGALLLGVFSFLGITLFNVQLNKGQGVNPPQDMPVVSIVAVAGLALLGPLSAIVPNVMTRSALQKILVGKWRAPSEDPSWMHATGGAKLWAVRSSTMVVRLALLEGSAFLGVIAYMLEAQILALCVIGVAVFLMLCQFPTEQRVRTWLERQAAVLTEMHREEEQTGNH